MFISLLLTEPLLFSRVVLILLISVSLHELAHGFAALSQGDDTPVLTGHMTANPAVHLGWPSIIMLCLAGIVWGQMPVNPQKFRSQKWGSILVAASGPLVNLGLALFAIAVLALVTAQGLDHIISLTFFFLIARINLVLFLFNLLPIPPLDGFHVLSEIIPSFKPLKDSPFGMAVLMIIFVTGVSSVLFDGANAVIQALLNVINVGMLATN